MHNKHFYQMLLGFQINLTAMSIFFEKHIWQKSVFFVQFDKSDSKEQSA